MRRLILVSHVITGFHITIHTLFSLYSHEKQMCSSYNDIVPLVCVFFIIRLFFQSIRADVIPIQTAYDTKYCSSLFRRL
jgi:hypothetical protein